MNPLDLFSPLTLREVTFRNRVGVSPTCQYSCQDGLATDWHLVHYGSRAVGGAGLVIMEATSVLPEGRMSPGDLGLWNDAQIAGLERSATFISQQGAVAGIQLSHAGRKACLSVPWLGAHPLPVAEGGWLPLRAPSAVAFGKAFQIPEALDLRGIRSVVIAFGEAARRAWQAGFQFLEINAGQGHLLHQFLSPLSNLRVDEYGGTFENRIRIVREVVRAVRSNWPEHLPLGVRISGSDWMPGGWDIGQAVELIRVLKPLGVDLADCPSGGLMPGARIPISPGYQIPFAERIKQEVEIVTAAVGLISEPVQANEIIRSERADLVFLARAMLRDPYWPFHAAQELGVTVHWPVQYARVSGEVSGKLLVGTVG